MQITDDIIGRAVPIGPVRKKTNFTGDVLKLVSGTTISQAIVILSAPFLTRLFLPEAFGTLALFTAITSILGVIVCMRYELAIMLPDRDEEAVNLLGVSLGSAVLVSIFAVLIIILLKDNLVRWLNAPGLTPYLWLIPIMVFVRGVFLAINYWNSRTKHFGRLSIARVTSSIATTSTMLGAGYAGYATGGTMIGASVVGLSIATAVLGGQILRNDKRLFMHFIRWKKMLLTLKRYHKFPRYSTWSALLNAISWMLPTFLLSMFFSSTVVGYYALGFRILQMPMSLIGNAIAQVFFQRTAEAKVQGTLTYLVENSFRRLVMIGLFPMLMLTIIGRDLYIVLFGAGWAEAGVYTQILSVWTFFWFVSSPLSTLPSVLEKQEFDLKINSLNFATRLIALLIGGLFKNPRLSILLFASAGVIIYGYLLVWIHKKSGASLHNLARTIGGNFLLFLPAGILLIILKIVGVHSWVLLSTSVVVLILWIFYLLKTQKFVIRQ